MVWLRLAGSGGRLPSLGDTSNRGKPLPPLAPLGCAAYGEGAAGTAAIFASD
jgi:hypothetical protein